MASKIQQAIKGAGGQLYKTSEEELQKKAAEAGLPAPPTTPVSASTLGVGPDTAKMLGTPNQMRKAIQMSSQPTALADVERRQDVRRAQTEREQQLTQVGQRLGQLEDLGQATQARAQAAVRQAINTDLEAQLLVAADTNPALIGAMEELAAEPANPAKAYNVMSALGLDPDDPAQVARFNPDELLASYTPAVEQVAQEAADRISRQNIQAGTLDWQSLGFKSQDEVAQLLGVAPAELAQMSVEDVILATESALAKDFDQADDLRSILEDPYASPAEQAEARKQLRDLGATGIKSAESSLEQMAEEIESADTIKLFGQEMKIDEMLNNQNVSRLIAGYLQLPEGNPDKQAFDQGNPELAAWIKRNKSTLEQAAQQIRGNFEGVIKVAAENVKAMSDPEGNLYPPEVLRSWSMQPGKGGEMPPIPPIFSMAKNLPASDPRREKLSQIIAASAGAPLRFMSTLRQMGESEWRTADLDDVLKRVQFAKAAATADVNNPDAVAQAYGAGSADELFDAYEEYTRQKNAGLVPEGAINFHGINTRIEGTNFNPDSPEGKLYMLGELTKNLEEFQRNPRAGLLRPIPNVQAIKQKTEELKQHPMSGLLASYGSPERIPLNAVPDENLNSLLTMKISSDKVDEIAKKQYGTQAFQDKLNNINSISSSNEARSEIARLEGELTSTPRNTRPMDWARIQTELHALRQKERQLTKSEKERPAMAAQEAKRRAKEAIKPHTDLDRYYKYRGER